MRTVGPALRLRSSLIAVAVTAEKAAAPVLLASRRSGLHEIEGLGRTRDHPRAAEIARVRPEPRFAISRAARPCTILVGPVARHIILVAVARRIQCERRLLARVAHAARCGGAIIIIGNGSVWRRRGACLRRCLLLRRRRYLLLVARRLIALWLGAELLRDSGARRRGARRLKLRCRAERLRGQNRLRQWRGTRLRLLLWRRLRLERRRRSRRTGRRIRFRAADDPLNAGNKCQERTHWWRVLRRRRRGLIVRARIRPQLRGQSAVDRINGEAANEAAEQECGAPMGMEM